MDEDAASAADGELSWSDLAGALEERARAFGLAIAPSTPERDLAASMTEAGLPAEVVRFYDPSQLASLSIGGFRVVSPLGIGGMGAVFRAQQLSLDREVALKLLDPFLAQTPDARARFHREGRSAVRLSHPHVVQVIDYGEEDGIPFLAMELLHGGSVRDALHRAGPFSERRALEVARDVALALAYAEKQGVVHRDVKPDNVLFDQHGVTKLADFGLARTARPDATPITRSDTMVGSPAYASPEQALNLGPFDTRTDLYGLGITLFEMLTGAPPFVADTPIEVLRQHLNAPLPDVRDAAPETAGETAALLRTLCAKDRADRPQTAAEVVRALERRLDALETAPPPERGSRPPESALLEPAPVPHEPEAATKDGVTPPRRPWRRGWVAASLIALVLAGTGLGIWKLRGGGGGADRGRGALRVEQHAVVRTLLSRLLARRLPDGGFGDLLDARADPWSTAEALETLLVLGKEVPAGPEVCAELVRVLDKIPVRGDPGRDAAAFAGFAYDVVRDNVACTEATSAVGVAAALAVANGHVGASSLARKILRFLLETQTADGSWATVPPLGRRGASTGATVLSTYATVLLSVTVGDAKETARAVERGARWIAGAYRTDLAGFVINPRRQIGPTLTLSGLNDEAVYALLHAQSFRRRLGLPPDPRVATVLQHYAAHGAGWSSPIGTIHRALEDDYSIGVLGLGAEYRSGVTSDQWVAFTWRLLVAPQLAKRFPAHAREWEATAAAVRASSSGLEAAFGDAPAWQLAEALLAVSLDARDGTPPLLLDLVAPRDGPPAKSIDQRQ